jgi:hypothetical protein
MAPPDAIRETVRLRGATAVAGAYLEVYRQFAGR